MGKMRGDILDWGVGWGGRGVGGRVSHRPLCTHPHAHTHAYILTRGRVVSSDVFVVFVCACSCDRDCLQGLFAWRAKSRDRPAPYYSIDFLRLCSDRRANTTGETTYLVTGLVRQTAARGGGGAGRERKRNGSTIIHK
jgi:hypothetical protein